MKIHNVHLGTRLVYQVFLHITVLVLAIEVVVLSNRADKMETALSRLTARSIVKGDTVRFGDVRSLGTSEPIRFGARNVVFLFTTLCPYCERNIESWQKIAKHASSKGLQVAAICLNAASNERGELLKYLRAHQISYPVYSVRNLVDFRKSNNVQAVPQTMICSSSGIIERVWSGALGDNIVAEITTAISN